MENQHEHIKGYRDLSEKEIEAMNDIKNMENLIGQVLAGHKEQANAGKMSEIQPDPRCLAEARTCLQTGFMWWVRAFAKPESDL